MVWTTIIILVSILGISYFTTRSLLHPAVVTAGIWSVMLILYNAIDWGLYALSDNIYLAISCWAIPLCVCSLLPSLYAPIVAPFAKRPANENIVKILCPIALISLVIAILAVIYRGRLYDASNIFHGIRQASVAAFSGEDSKITFPIYVQLPIELAFSLVTPLVLYLSFIKNEKSRIARLLLVLMIIFILIRSNKYAIAQTGLAFFCILAHQHRINKRNFLIIIATFMVFLILVHLLRRTQDADQFVFLDFLTLYLMGPLPAMDSILSFTPGTMIESFNGEYTFRAFQKILQIFDPSLVGNSDPFNLKNWTAVPIWINVYTILFGFYADFGYLGLIIGGAAYGLLGGILFKHMKAGYLIATLMYAEIFYVFVFQFFADFGITYFWTHMSVLLCILLMTIPVAKRA